MLGVEFPICAFSHCRDVVAAVTNAGGFGVLGATAHSPRRLESELAWIEEQTGGKPYGVDLLLPPKYVGAEQGGIDTTQARTLLPDEHRAFVEDLLARYGVTAPPEQSRGSGGGLSVSPKMYEPLLDVAFSSNIRLIASALGPPPADVVSRAHDQDVLVAALAGTTRHAQRHAAAGVDLIVAQGTEAGGHTGEVATMVLVPEVVDAVAPVPVLAAGGIARLYAEIGLRVRADAHELPDHLAIEWEALTFALEQDAAEAAASLVDEHLALWMPPFCAAVEAETVHPYYAALASLTAGWTAALAG